MRLRCRGGQGPTGVVNAARLCSPAYVNSVGTKKPLEFSALTHLRLCSDHCSTSDEVGVPLSFQVPYYPPPE